MAAKHLNYQFSVFSCYKRNKQKKNKPLFQTRALNLGREKLNHGSFSSKALPKITVLE